MRKAAKIWLWCALALSVATTLLNAFSGRMLSVVIALAALAGLCILLFTERKAGYLFMCVCYLCSFINGLISGFTTDTKSSSCHYHVIHWLRVNSCHYLSLLAKRLAEA